VFDLQMISTARRALRLQRDLHLDWEAVALVLDLLSERDRLREENQQLHRRLQRLTEL
jgi:chaperone modulatory protein CbpM